MRITFALKQFQDKRANEHLLKHFLLEPARIVARLTFSDSSEKFLKPVAKEADGKFFVDIDADDVPDKPDASGTVHKLKITRLLIDVFVDFRYEGKTFRLLRIVQEFSLTPGKTNSDTLIDYTLTPFAWAHNKTQAMVRKTSNASVHPLLDMKKLNRNEIGVNALVLDLTELWDHLHKDNKYTQYYKELTEPTRVTFKVFAHLGGNAFIWYAIVPSYIATSSKISPHVFYFPSDWAAKQNDKDEESYLFDNATEFEAQSGSDSAFNGEILFLSYLLPPVDDDRIPLLNPKEFDKASFAKWVIAHRRNVVNFKYTDATKTTITLKHFDIGAGFERAFYGVGKVKPQQILLMPQVTGDDGLKVDKGNESTRHLKNVTNAILDVLQTNTNLLITANKDQVINKDKIVLSCFSESGFDLWRSSAEHADSIKAIIGIEPNSVNSANAKKIIEMLLLKKVKVFLIGHVGPGQFYRPKMGAVLESKIRFLPDQPKILRYPPDPNSNDFVKYRTARVQSETLDPYMLTREKSLLHDLATQTPPKKGKDAIPLVFTTIANSYDLKDGDVSEIFYTHHFALTGGQEMTLADPNDFYKKPVKYRTFFQQAVEEIG
jgi:hypothetical protein